jgi:hypothetical protein
LGIRKGIEAPKLSQRAGPVNARAGLQPYQKVELEKQP